MGALISLSRHLGVSIPVYLYVRCARRLPEWLFGAMITIHLCFEASQVLRFSNPDPSSAVALTLAGLGGALAPALRIVICTVGLGTVFLISLSSALGGPFLLSFSKGSRGETVSLVTIIATPTIVAMLLCLFIINTMNRFSSMLATAEANVALEHRVARLLKEYDTEGVAAELALHQGGRSECDAGLINVFGEINANLESYRPHLPNYVLPTANDGAADDEDEEETGGPCAPPSHRSAGPPTAKSADPKSRGSAAPSARSTGSDTRSGSLDVPSPALVETDVTRACRITVAAVSTTWARGVVPAADANELVLRVSEIAVATHASLHSFLGDEVVATWNATKRVAKAESKACSFAVRLRDALKQSAGLGGSCPCAVRIATGEAQVVFGGSVRFRAFLCSAPAVVGRLHALRAFASVPTEPTRIVIDRETRSHAMFDFQTRGCALLAEDDPACVASDPLSRCVYDVVNERAVDRSSTNQEWMYDLEHSMASEPSTRISQALHLFAEGKLADALALLRDQPEESDAATRRLLADVESGVLIGAKVETAPPHLVDNPPTPSCDAGGDPLSRAGV